MYDVLFRDIGHLVLAPGNEVTSAWPAVSDGRVAAVGPSGTEPEAAETRSRQGRLATPGLITRGSISLSVKDGGLPPERVTQGCDGSASTDNAWHLDPVSVAGALSDPVEALLRCGPDQK